MITFNQVSKHYPGGSEALKQINLSVGKGELMFLTGNSGSGKTTLLKLIAMLELPSSGKIVINGQRFDQLKRRDIAAHRASLGVTLQTPNLLMDRSVFDNVALPLHLQGVVSKHTLKQRVHAALDRVGLLTRQTLLPGRLSGGEQQRVSIARAIVHQPLMILADEPTANLDADLSLDVIQLFEQLNQDGVGVLVATHDLALIASMKYRIVMLKGGRVC